MRRRTSLMGTAWFYFISMVIALVVAMGFWLTGSDVSIVLLALGCVAITGILVVLAHLATKKYKDE